MAPLILLFAVVQKVLRLELEHHIQHKLMQHNSFHFIPGNHILAQPLEVEEADLELETGD